MKMTKSEIKSIINASIKEALKTKKEVTITELFPLVGDEFKVSVDTYTTPMGDFNFDFNIESQYKKWKQNVTVSSSNWDAYELFSGDMLQGIVDMFYDDIIVRFEIRKENEKEA